MRFGLIGTGHWARVAHATALLSEPGVTLAGVWGRDPAKARSLAGELGVAAHEDVDDLISGVDALAFSVPPDVQVDLAVRAARVRKHLLLEKPIATSTSHAQRLVSAVQESGVATVVFFTHRFTLGQREWIEQAGGDGGWDHGTGFWLGSAFEPGSPFDTPWRRVKGPLWDVGPHALSVLVGALGPVREVRALSGRRGLVTLLMRHRDGATSTAALSLSAPVAAARSGATLWGPDGVTEMPPSTAPVTDALGVAIRELTAAAREGGEHPCGVSFGRDVVEVLADAEAQLAEPDQGGVTRAGVVRASDDG